MRSITDRNGTIWEVEETGRHGVGARGPGQPLPEPTEGTVVFKSADGRKVVKTTAAGAVDTMSDSALLELLEEPHAG
jgi:hypothetical protein